MDEYDLPEFSFDNPILVRDQDDEPLTEEEKLKREIARRMADRVLEEEATTGQRSVGRDIIESTGLNEAGPIPQITTHPQVYISNQGPLPDAPANPDDILGSNPPVTQTSPFTLNEIQNAIQSSNLLNKTTPGLPPADAAGTPEMRSVPSTIRDELAALLTGDQRPSGQAYRMLREGIGSAGAGGNPELSALDFTPVGPGVGVNEALANENYGSAALNTLGGVAPVIAKPLSAVVKPVAQQLAELANGAPTAVKTGLAATGLFGAMNTATGKAEIEPTVKMETVGGLADIPVSDLATLGSLVAVTTGMVFAPQLFSKFKTGSVPRLRSVSDAAPGTMAMSTPVDLARTYDDVNAGALRILRRAGVHANAADEVQKAFRIQTRSAANSIANSAITTGRAETPNFTFKTKQSLVDLNKLDNPVMRQYLHALHTGDELLLARQKPGVNAGPPVVRGMTMQDVLNTVNALERSNPLLRRVGAAYRDNLKSMRQFESTGEYATLSSKRVRYLNAQRPNYVPVKSEGKPIMGNAVAHPNAFQELADEMKTNLRKRMENEAVGKYIDEVRKVQPDMFVPVTSKELADNPNWQKNTVTMYRRGKKEMYTTDPFLADVLKMDPYYITSMSGNLLYGTKRLIEMTTTGELAPHFAATSMLRSWHISKHTTPAGYKSPSLGGTLAAIPQQLYPQMARSIAGSLDRGSGGWIGDVFGQANVQLMAQKLAKVYDDSLFAQLRSVGTHQGSIMEQQTAASNKLINAIRQATPRARAMLQGYRSLLGAVHNAHAYNFVRKNYRKRGSTKTLAEVSADARALTGDPSIGGQYKVGGSGNPIRFEGDNRLSQTGGAAAKAYGWASELGRESVPWFNYTQQGMKRIGEAYLDNPAKFAARTWLYTMMPAAATYYGARSLDKDPNGRSYVDYMMNGRSEYQKTMNYYIPIPGRPVEEGIEWPRFHEVTIAARLMENALDHAFKSNLFKQSEDFDAAARSFINVAIMPPMPPVGNIARAGAGMSPAENLFSADGYTKRTDPFDQTGGFPSSVELFTRAIAGGIADLVGAGYAAYSQTPEKGMQGFMNALKEMGKREIAKTPLVRNAAGLQNSASGNTRITEEMFTKQRALTALVKYMQQWSEMEDGTRGELNIKPRSFQGGLLATDKLGKPIPSQSAGIDQPPITNPLYQMFAEELYNRVKKDTVIEQSTAKIDGVSTPVRKGTREPITLEMLKAGIGEKTGGEGTPSLWARYGNATNQLRRLKNINAGNFVTWQRQLAERPEQIAYLKENNVNYKDVVAVRNHYEKVRQDAARVILFTIKKMEAEFSQRAGRPITIEMLSPYGNQADPNLEQSPEDAYSITP